MMTRTRAEPGLPGSRDPVSGARPGRKETQDREELMAQWEPEFLQLRRQSSEGTPGPPGRATV